jgi:hypothetical protein
MSELIAALTRAANAVAIYYEKQASPLQAVTPRESEALETAMKDEPVKTRKPRAPKAETVTLPEAPAAGAAVAIPTAPVAAKDMSEDDSVLEIRNVAKAYAKRFANQLDGVAAFRKLMADTCKVGKMDDLVHAQRLQLIGVVKAEIAKADKPAGVAVASSGAGTEV